MAHTVILGSAASRTAAIETIRAAPSGWVMILKEPKRSLEQNNRMWAMLTDISRSKPMGCKYNPEDWKVLLMHLHGYECRFLPSLSDDCPLPVGYSSRNLSKSQMTEFMDFIDCWGTERGVEWSEDAQNQ